MTDVKLWAWCQNPPCGVNLGDSPAGSQVVCQVCDFVHELYVEDGMLLARSVKTSECQGCGETARLRPVQCLDGTQADLCSDCEAADEEQFYEKAADATHARQMAELDDRSGYGDYLRDLRKDGGR